MGQSADVTEPDVPPHRGYRCEAAVTRNIHAGWRCAFKAKVKINDSWLCGVHARQAPLPRHYLVVKPEDRP